MTDLTLTEWLEATQERRAELEAFAAKAVIAEASERRGDIETSIRYADDAGRLLADAESFLSFAKAQALLEALKRDDLNGKDREVIIRSEVRGVQRLVDGLTVTVKTINNRIFAGMNANRSRL